MECSCAVDTCDEYEPVEMLKMVTRVARKTHKCGECKKPIVSGDLYEHTSYKFDGRFWIDKTCRDCLSARRKFYPRGGYCVGDLWGEIRDHVSNIGGEVPEDCLADMTTTARNKVCDIIESFY
jgi:hypothetical protein